LLLPQKIQLQLSSFAASAAATQPKYAGVGDVVRSTFRQHGLRGFYSGASMFFAFALPRSAVRFTTFQGVGSSLRRSDPAGPLTAVERAGAGLITGVVEAVTIVTPMTTIQTKLVQSTERTGLVRGVRVMVAEDGWRGVYQGGTATVVKVAINQCVRFVCYADFRGRIASAVQRARGEESGTEMAQGAASVAVSLTAGALAGAVSVLANQPIDVVKSNMQGLHAKRYRGVLDCASTIVREDGWAGLYKGLGPRLARVAVEVSLTFSLFEIMSAAVDSAIHGVPFRTRTAGS